MVALRFSRDDFLLLGLKLSGFSVDTIQLTCCKTNLERFKAHFCASPESHSDTFKDIQSDHIGEARIVKPRPRHVLLALHRLKACHTKHELATFLDTSEKTVLDWAKHRVRSVQALNEKKARKNDRER